MRSANITVVKSNAILLHMLFKKIWMFSINSLKRDILTKINYLESCVLLTKYEFLVNKKLYINFISS